MTTETLEQALTELQEVHAKQLSEQVKRGQEHSLQHGRWPGLAPLGYLNVRRKGEARIEIDPVAGPLIQQAFAFAAEGNYSLSKVLEIMTERGLRSKRGKPLGIVAFLKLLSNPFYVGKLHFRGTVRQGVHDPLIDTHTFDQVQRKLAKGSSTPASRTEAQSRD